MHLLTKSTNKYQSHINNFITKLHNQDCCEFYFETILWSDNLTTSSYLGKSNVLHEKYFNNSLRNFTIMRFYVENIKSFPWFFAFFIASARQFQSPRVTRDFVDTEIEFKQFYSSRTKWKTTCLCIAASQSFDPSRISKIYIYFARAVRILIEFYLVIASYVYKCALLREN